MGRHRRYSGPPRRHYAFAVLTDAEFVVAKAAARTAGLTMSDFVRRCINSYLLEGGDDVPLLQEKEIAPRRSTGNVSAISATAPIGGQP
ncbi:MAG: hypothetical protein ABJA98_01565 [Acidobacteriota bacterium]